mgnify:CR=1 FL=1
MKLVIKIESEPWTYTNTDGAYWCYEIHYDID